MRILMLACIGALIPECAATALRPDEVAIIAVRGSRESRELAAYYARAREIPESHICLIDVKPGATLDRAEWQLKVRPHIRQWLLQNQLGSQVRCLVTVWDVPLKIGKLPDEFNEGRRVFLQSNRRLRVQRLQDVCNSLHRLAADPDAANQVTLEWEETLEDLIETLQQAAQGTQQRLAANKRSQTAAANSAEFLKALYSSGGVTATIQFATAQQKAGQSASLENTLRIERTRGHLLGLREGLTALEGLPDSIERDEQILTLIETSHGLLGTVRWIDTHLELIRGNESHASFDSELSLVFWPDYPLIRWRPNLLHYSFDGKTVRDVRLTLMVSRIEAPTIELARKLVDNALAVEKKGLQGKVYIDARGQRGQGGNPQRGSIVEQDQSLRNLAKLLEDHTDLDVTLDNNDDLFQAGDCPDASIYCGWYSLASYVAAFEFNAGAIAYHIASLEAATLRDTESQVWCKRLLEEGVCATLGPVDEPYLVAFPLPDEFFVSVLSGKYSLVESYYRTKPDSSWMMVLVGDPLYNPFANKPPIKTEDLPSRYHRVVGE